MTDQSSPFNSEMTLHEARTALRKLVEAGADCPCCTQFAKVYRRKLNSGMAYALIKFYRVCGCSWGYKPDVLRGVGAAARDESLLRYWGLIEEDERLREDGSSRNGWWRVTSRGEKFVFRELSVHSHAHVYNGRCLKLSGEHILIDRALGNKFNYAELMADGGLANP